MSRAKCLCHDWISRAPSLLEGSCPRSEHPKKFGTSRILGRGAGRGRSDRPSERSEIVIATCRPRVAAPDMKYKDHLGQLSPN